MADSQAPEDEADRAFGRLLRFWRGVHGVSQEDLAHDLGSSPRHISRLENGRVRPSRSMVERIARQLSLGERDANTLLISAGYQPAPRALDFHAAELKWLRKAMTLTLRAMDPYPAVLVDGQGEVLMVNRGWVGFFQAVVPREELDEVTHYYEFLFSLPGFGNSSGWKDTLSVILMSLQQGALLGSDESQQRMIDRLLASPNTPPDWRQRAARLEPMASFRVPIEVDGQARRFFSVSQTVGAMGPTPYVSEPRLTVTTIYPEDEEAMDLDSLVAGELSHPRLFY